jgi:hypothetical protein
MEDTILTIEVVGVDGNFKVYTRALNARIAQ